MMDMKNMNSGDFYAYGDWKKESERISKQKRETRKQKARKKLSFGPESKIRKDV